jgi:hypothetical protein
LRIIHQRHSTLAEQDEETKPINIISTRKNDTKTQNTNREKDNNIIYKYKHTTKQTNKEKEQQIIKSNKTMK